MNVVCLLGRLTADPELRHTPNQIPVTSFSIAVDRPYRGQDQQRQTDFINVVAWRGTAEFICRYFHRGNRIAIQGSLQTRQFLDKDNNKRTVYEVVAENAYFAESKSSGGGNFSPAPFPTPEYSETAPAFSTAAPGDFEEIVGDDDLPF